MTIEQLLLPRWKVIVNYPDSRYPKGTIFTNGRFEIGESIGREDIGHLSLYPDVFRKIKWYEDRELKDLEDVKFIRFSRGKDCTIHKVEKWDRHNSNGLPVYTYLTPWINLSSASTYSTEIATEQEYLDYQNSIK